MCPYVLHENYNSFSLELITPCKILASRCLEIQTQCFVELSSFNDLARFVCAFREYPLRVYSHEFNGTRVLSSSLTLANTLLLFYTPMTKFGRYISYNAIGGKEYCDVVQTTKNISTYAPIIHLESEISTLPTNTEKISQ
jgi:hypothetical protein